MTAIEALAAVLDDLAAVVDSLTDTQYADSAIPGVSGSVGGHVRHCLDHVRALERAIETGVVDYDARERELRVEIDRTNRERRQQVRSALIGILIAIAVVIVLSAVAEVVERRVTGTFGTALREALVISGWVLMWRPLDVMVYDRIAWVRNRRSLESIRDAAIAVRTPP